MNFLLKMLLLSGSRKESLPNLPNTEFLKTTIEPKVSVTQISYEDSFGEENINASISEITISVSEV
jgi:hypothetical protein